MLKGFFRKTKDDSESEQSISNSYRSEEKKMPKKSISSRFFGSSTKHLTSNASDISAPKLANQHTSGTEQDDKKVPSSDKMDSPKSGHPIDNRSAITLQHEDEHKAGVDDAGSDGFSDRLSVKLHSELAEPNTFSIPKPNVTTDSTVPRKPIQKQSSDSGSDSVSLRDVPTSLAPPPTPPHGIPRNAPPAVFRDVSELTANASKLHHVGPPENQPQQQPRSSLPVHPQDVISQSRSNLKHTSAAQERRIQQQQQQQQQQQKPVYGRALLKQTSQFDRLVDAPRSPMSHSHKQISNHPATLQHGPLNSTSAKNHSDVADTNQYGNLQMLSSGVISRANPSPPEKRHGHVADKSIIEEGKRPSASGSLFRGVSNASDAMAIGPTHEKPSGFGARASALSRGAEISPPSPGDDVSVISSISGASGLVSSRSATQQPPQSSQPSRHNIHTPHLQQQSSEYKSPPSRMRLPVSSTHRPAPRGSMAHPPPPEPLPSAAMTTSHKSSPTKHSEGAIERGSRQASHISSRHQVMTRSVTSSPSCVPPMTAGDDVSLPPPPEVPASTKTTNATGGRVSSGVKGGHGRDDRSAGGEVMSEEEREKFLAEERMKWKILPKSKEYKGSWTRRLFKEVGSDGDEDGGYSDKSPTDPVTIVEGTFAAELIHLIESTRVSGGGKPVVVDKKSDAKRVSTVSTETITTAEGKASTRKPFSQMAGDQGSKPSASHIVANDEDELKSMDSADFDEEQYFKLIAALPGLTEHLGEKECWEMKKPGGEKINVVFGGSTQSTQEAARLIAKAKKHKEQKELEDREKSAALHVESEEDFKKLSDLLRYPTGAQTTITNSTDASVKGEQPKPERVGRKTMVDTLITTMVPLRVGMDDEWRRNDEAMRLQSRLSQDAGLKHTRRATGDMSAVDLRFLLAHDKYGAEVEKHVDFSLNAGGENSVLGGRNTKKSTTSNGTDSRPQLTYKEKVWRRAADHMNLSFSTADPELQALKSTAAKQGLELLEKEFGTYRHKDSWEGLEVFKKQKKQRIKNSQQQATNSSGR